MDRVTFLLQQTGERIPCLLNPESLQIFRRAGLRARRSTGGVLTGRGATDDPLLYTGGGTTELRLDLLFDVSLAGSSIQTDNVRDLTGPLWRLAENVVDDDGYGSVSVVRFVWGRVWNIPGVVAEVAERYEAFSSEGAPQRSWMRMKFLRVDGPDVEPERPVISPEEAQELLAQAADRDLPPDRTEVIEVAGGSSRENTPDQEPVSERLYDVAYDAGFHPSYWRVFANHNDIDDPFHLPPGTRLQLPAIEPPRQA
jgi:hypothetical protein